MVGMLSSTSAAIRCLASASRRFRAAVPSWIQKAATSAVRGGAIQLVAQIRWPIRSARPVGTIRKATRRPPATTFDRLSWAMSGAMVVKAVGGSDGGADAPRPR